MPELPEVETVVREIRHRLTGKRIRAMDVLWHKTLDSRCRQTLIGQKIIRVDRKGKYILLELEQSWLIIHLRMTGQLLLNPSSPPAHLRILLELNDGMKLAFNDVRKFGRWYHVQSVGEILNRVGMDAMDDAFTAEKFIRLLSNSRTRIKPFLLSQRFIAGLGNIYVDESLFRSAIHPLSICSEINNAAAKKLFNEIREVLTFAIENMGSTISDYRDANGRVGNAQNFFYVYQQQGRACKFCGTIIEKMRVAGRGTHYCPTCQIIYG